jgi:hypothetical protein
LKDVKFFADSAEEGALQVFQIGACIEITENRQMF